ncbi:MAG: DNA repair protein RadC [Anaerolineaceae bacterium]|nr:DNA repair protein RadC [Anaerolineaceae bacterium]
MENNKKTVKIEDLQESDKPRERMATVGVQALSNAELLAVLLNSGTRDLSAIDLGSKLLNDFGGFKGLHRADLSSLMEVKGVGLAKAARIKAAVEVGYRLSKERDDEPVLIKTPEDIYEVVGFEMESLSQEELWLLMLNSRNRYLGKEKLYKGSQDATTVRVGEIFKEAVRKNVYAIALVHNHPSGNPAESPEDVNMTRAVIEAGRILDIRLLDHLIVAGDNFTSIRRNHPDLWA